MEKVRALIQNRPLTSVLVVGVTALLLGVGMGLSDTGQQADLERELSDVEQERDEAETLVDDLQDELVLTEDDLSSARADLQKAEDRARRAEAQAQRAKDQAAAAEDEAAAVEDAQVPAEPAETGGTYTVGEFTISDVQVSEDFVGDFEMRARVTNNGEAADFVQIQATLFGGGSVVSDLEAIEDFDAGQVRTVTFIGTDAYEQWDEIEFTVDEGF